MANTITVTAANSLTWTTDLELDLYAGSPDGSTAWLDGGAAADSYPGALDGFQAKNSNTTEAVGGMKLLCGRLGGTVANGDTLTLSGGATTVIAVMTANGMAANAVLSATFSGAIVTYALGAGTGTTGQTVWIICA